MFKTIFAKSCALTLVLTSSFMTSAIAQEVGPYGYVRLSGEHVRFADDHPTVPSANVKTIGLRGGYMFLPMIGLELRGSTTASKQEWGSTPIGEAELDYSAGALLRIQANIDPGIAPYVLLGAGTSKLTYDYNGNVGSMTETGFVGALGLDLQFKNRITVGIEAGQSVQDSMTFGLHTGFDF